MKRSERHRYADTYSLVAQDKRVGRAMRFATEPLADDETLVGLLTRATAEHVLYAVTNVIRRVGVNVRQPGFVSRLDPSLLVPLANILGCDIKDILTRTTPLETAEIPRSNVLVGDISCPPEWLETEKRRISPLTLGEAPFHRADWLFRLLPYCPISLERMCDTCSNCGKPLSWRKTWGIERCETCEEVVRPSNEPLLQPEYVEGYQLFAALLSPVLKRRCLALATLPQELQCMQGRDLINFCIDLGLACRSNAISISRKCIARCPPETLAEVVATGAEFLRGWPRSIIDWSQKQADRLVGSPVEFDALRKRLQRLGKSNSISLAQKALVRSALPHLFTNYVHSFAKRSDVMFSAEICKSLPLRMADLDALRAAGHLTYRELPSKTFRRVQYDAQQIRSIRARYHSSVPVSGVCSRLGLPVYALEQAACLSLVKAELDPVIRRMREMLSLERTSTENLIRKLESQGQVSGVPSEALPLGTASRRIGGRLKPWGAILGDLTKGRLAYWLLDDNLPLSRRIVVIPEELCRYDDMAFDQSIAKTFPFEPHFNKNDAAEVLNVTPARIAKVLEQFDVRARGCAQYVLRQQVLDYAAGMISCGEIDQRAASNPRRTKSILRNRPDLQLAGGWDRGAVLELDLFDGLRVWMSGSTV